MQVDKADLAKSPLAQQARLNAARSGLCRAALRVRSPSLAPPLWRATRTQRRGSGVTLPPLKFGNRLRWANPPQSHHLWSWTWSNLRTLFRSGLPIMNGARVVACRVQCRR